MKWIVRLLAVVAALALMTLLMFRLPSEDAIRFAGYAGTAAFAGLMGLLFRWRASRAQRNNKRV
ncbi:hypothetical protein [Paraburkholderia sp. BCC1876]|uniref:hypothetical protein n=1 Tax=Paraburkholderia sp. BCC1876 TaxID=2676303 RepID=UPI0015905C0B|nr:hypothetical protein [Paraburkholderia sp. BCC1876]